MLIYPYLTAIREYPDKTLANLQCSSDTLTSSLDVLFNNRIVRSSVMLHIICFGSTVPIQNFVFAPLRPTTLMNHPSPGDNFGPPIWLLIVPTYVSGEYFLPYICESMLTSIDIMIQLRPWYGHS